MGRRSGAGRFQRGRARPQERENGRSPSPQNGVRVTGTFIAHPSGFGFVAVDGAPTGPGKDLFIPARATGGAVDGDRVQARSGGFFRGRAAGVVEAVLERALKQVVGLFVRGGRDQHALVPFDPRRAFPLRIRDEGAGQVQDGHAVVVAIERWPEDEHTAAVGRVARVLGHPDAPGVDLQVVTAHWDLAPEPPGEAIREAEQLPPDPGSAREDLRGQLVVTIDPGNARDHDDALALEDTDEGWRLFVHIADVSHYVCPGTALDAAARERATSVYFPETAYHMLPARLAADLCSLREHEDRPAFTAVLEVARAGEVTGARFIKCLVRVDAKLSYEEAQAVLEGADGAHGPQVAHLVRRLDALTRVLHKARVRRGALDFDLPETLIVMGEEGRISDIVPKERLDAHRLVEECMLLANEAVAAHLKERKRPCLRRVHAPPDPDKLAELHQAVSHLRLPKPLPPPDERPRRALQNLILSQEGTPEGRFIAWLALRAMMQARYAPDDEGHYGLALEDYAHFTSPIRRYPDLLVHRALEASLRNGAPPDDHDALVQEGRHCSARERRAEQAERDLIAWRKARHLHARLGDEFDAIVTGVSRFGLHLELQEVLADAFLPAALLGSGHLRFDRLRQALIRPRDGKRFSAGTAMRVSVVRVDVWTRRIECSLPA